MQTQTHTNNHQSSQHRVSRLSSAGLYKGARVTDRQLRHKDRLPLHVLFPLCTIETPCLNLSLMSFNKQKDRLWVEKGQLLTEDFTSKNYGFL